MLAALLMAAQLVCAQAQPQEKWQGAEAPEFVRQSIAGGKVDLGALRGQVVLLNFWATWCAPCQIEMPKFVAWQKQYGAAGLRIVGLSMDDDAATVRKVTSRLKVDYPVVMADADVVKAYGALSATGGVLGLPLTYLIDRNGRIEHRFEGEVDPALIEDAMRGMLANRQ